MIAQRFRPMGWVAGIAAAACALYMISLQVASERGRLEEIDRKISSTKRDIRQLQTELGTRASLRQLERWNSEVLALSAPKAGQFLHDEQSLATLDRSGLVDSPTAPPPVMMAAMTHEPKPAAAAPSIIAKLTTATPEKPLTETDKAVQNAIAPRQTARAPAAKPQKVAMLDRALIDRSTMGEIARKASTETAGRGKPKP